MAFDAHVNGGYSTVATAPSPATSGTSLVVASGEGARFPTPPFNATVWAAGTIWLPTGVASTTGEVVRVTAISTDTLTIVRAQESSTARTIVVNDQIAASGTAKNITDIEGKFPVAIADGGTGQTAKTAAFDALSPVTTRGDLIVRDASHNVRLGVGGANTVVHSDGTDATWQALVAADIPSLAASKITSGTLAIAQGGTAQATALAARGSSGLNVEGLTAMPDGDLTGVATDRLIGVSTTLTGLRTYTLPAANSVNAGTELIVADFGGVNGGNLVAVTAHAGDTVSGAVFLGTSANIVYSSDGTSKWAAGILQVAQGGTGANTATSGFNALSPVTTQGDIIYRNATNNVRLGAGTSGQALITGGAAANPAWGAVTDVTAFTASGTWTKPANATWCRVIAIGSGGGGGGGRLGATASVRGGGGGGAPGNWLMEDFQAADLTGTVTVTIPAGGTAGAGKSGTAANGNNGGSPAAVTFGTFVSAAGGGAGGGGTTSAGAGGTATSDSIFSAPWYATGNVPGGAAGGVGAGSVAGQNAVQGSPGAGGGGGGITSGNAVDTTGGAGGGGGGFDHTNAPKLTGGAGGASTGASGTAGQNSGTSPSSSLTGGSGGGGGSAGTGAANTTGGGAGNNGGTWGGGAGGGGAGTTVTSTGTSGAGGTGGKGYVIVISYR